MDINGADFGAKSIQQILESVPYLLGFHPDECLVMLGVGDDHLRMSGQLGLVGNNVEPRLDRLPLTWRPPNIDAVILIGYGSASLVGAPMGQVRKRLDDLGISTIGFLRAHNGAYWLDPDDEHPSGTFDAVNSPTALHYVAAGHQAFDSRAALAARLDPVTGEERDAVAAAIRRICKRILTEDRTTPGNETSPSALARWGIGVLRQAVLGDGLPDVQTTASVGVVLQHPVVFAEALRLIKTADPAALIELWIWLVRHVPSGFIAAPALLLAHTAWLIHDAHLAVDAARVALVEEPGCVPARMYLGLLHAGVPASTFPTPGDMRPSG